MDGEILSKNVVSYSLGFRLTEYIQSQWLFKCPCYPYVCGKHNVRILSGLGIENYITQ